jgi:hypothetical protein
MAACSFSRSFLSRASCAIDVLRNGEEEEELALRYEGSADAGLGVGAEGSIWLYKGYMYALDLALGHKSMKILKMYSWFCLIFKAWKQDVQSVHGEKLLLSDDTRPPREQKPRPKKLWFGNACELQIWCHPAHHRPSQNQGSMLALSPLIQAIHFCRPTDTTEVSIFKPPGHHAAPSHYCCSRYVTID